MARDSAPYFRILAKHTARLTRPMGTLAEIFTHIQALILSIAPRDSLGQGALRIYFILLVPREEYCAKHLCEQALPKSWGAPNTANTKCYAEHKIRYLLIRIKVFACGTTNGHE